MSRLAEPTQEAAKARLRTHFAEILRCLPPGTALVLRHPELPGAVFHHGVTLSCDYGLDESRRFLDIRYWLLGAGPENCARYFGLVTGYWEARGWTRTSSPDSAGYADAPDGYGFSITQSVNGYLSVSGSTTPFPAGSAEGDPMPDRIDRPS